MLVWNILRRDTTPFLRAYEALVQRVAADYKKISRGWADDTAIERFFSPRAYEKRTLDNRQRVGFDGLRGRLLSASYIPPAGHPDHEPMLAELREIFDRHQLAGEVSLDYDVQLYWGRLG